MVLWESSLGGRPLRFCPTRFIRPSLLPGLFRNLMVPGFGDETLYVYASSQKIALGGDYVSKSDYLNCSYFPLRHTASSPVGRHVFLHDAHDDSAGPDHMVRSSGRRGFAVIVECLPCLCRSVVFGSGYRNTTRTSICHAWAGWC